MNKRCIRTIDEKYCGSYEAVETSKDGFNVCRPCRIEVTSKNLRKSDLAVVSSTKTTNIYIMETPFDTLKIGRASDVGRRMKELHRDFGGEVHLLACFTGTYYDESELHVRFDDYRLFDRLGEQFEISQEIYEYAFSVGINEAGTRGQWSYGSYQPTGTAKSDPDYFPSELRTLVAA